MNNEPWWKPSVELFARLSSLIAFPVLVAIFIGRWLDNKYHTEPWLFLACVGLAFVISMTGIIRITLVEFKKIADTKDDKKEYEDKSSGK